MSKRATIIYTTGAAGTGKTYARCARFLVDDFLPEQDGVCWSNYPLGLVPEHHDPPPRWEGETFRDRMAEAVSRRTGTAPGEYLRRLKLIPDDELERWRSGDSGPWEFFAEKDLAATHIAIDEIHVFCGRHTKGAVRKQWQDWLGEIRHRGATVEFLSQSPNKVAKEIAWEAGLRYQLQSGDEARGPVTKIPMSDWYELRAGWLTCKYECPIILMEQRATFGRFKNNAATRITRDAEYFAFYDSFSSPHSGGKGAKTQRYQFQKRSRLGLLGWFVARNSGPLVKVAAIIVGIGLLFTPLPMRGLTAFFALPVQNLNPAVAAGAAQGAGEAEPPSESPSDTTINPPSETDEPIAPIAPGAPGPAPVPAGRVASSHQAVSTEIPPDVVARIRVLEERLAEVQEARDDAVREVRSLRERVARWSELRVVTPTSATFASGIEYFVGERIEEGAFTGATIDAIDMRRRTVRLADGRLLRLGVQVRASDVAESSGDVRPPLRDAERDGAGGGAGG